MPISILVSYDILTTVCINLPCVSECMVFFVCMCVTSRWVGVCCSHLDDSICFLDDGL